MIKKWELSVVIALIITISLSCFSFSAQCSDIRQQVLRLHILANSDSSEDQALKLKVRDRLLSEAADLFKGAKTETDAANKARERISQLQSIAQQEISEQGYDYPVKVEVAKTYFNTRTYDNVTLPAGEYEAVRVLIGKAGGKNWWCVMFPPMCVPAAVPEQEIDDILNEQQVDIVTNKPKYEIKFKSVEIFQQLKQAVSDMF
ncbi:MAG: stage II sporulation protein R [Clostridia bacterium]|nr:stage II sporulation protein R [Clostridia bacterium]